MKIAQLALLSESVPPQKYGGVGRVINWLTEELVKSGEEVDLYASGDSKTTANLIAGCERNLRQTDRMPEFDALTILMIEELLRSDTKYDIVHSHIGTQPLPQLRHGRLPALSTIHHPVNVPARQALYTEFSDVPMVSISHSQRTPLPMANWAANIYNGLPEEKYSLVEKPRDYLLFLGLLSKGKGLGSAIEIARRSGVHIKVAGIINNRQESFERYIVPLLTQSGVEYVGEVGDSQKQELVGNALALLFPIEWEEPFGLVMIEAMACGTPVIAFDRASVREVVTHGSSGFICEDVESAVECIKQLKKISRAECRSIFEQRFTARRMAQEYMQVYRELSKHQAHPKSNASPLKFLERPAKEGHDLLQKDANSIQSSSSSKQSENEPDKHSYAANSFEIRKIEPGKTYTPIQFSLDSRLLVKGWGAPEPWGSWTVGARSTIELGCETIGGSNIEVKLQLRAFINEKQPLLKVTCRINDSKSVNWEFTKDNWQSEKSIIVTAVDWNEKRPAELVLDIHDPKSPQELGLSLDTRKIGLGILSIEVGHVPSSVP